MGFLLFIGVLATLCVGQILPRTVLAILMGIILGGGWWVLASLFIVIGLVIDTH